MNFYSRVWDLRPARPGRARLGMTLEPLLGSTALYRADVSLEYIIGTHYGGLWADCDAGGVRYLLSLSVAPLCLNQLSKSIIKLIELTNSANCPQKRQLIVYCY